MKRPGSWKEDSFDASKDESEVVDFITPRFSLGRSDSNALRLLAVVLCQLAGPSEIFPAHMLWPDPAFKTSQEPVTEQGCVTTSCATGGLLTRKSCEKRLVCAHALRPTAQPDCHQHQKTQAPLAHPLVPPLPQTTRRFARLRTMELRPLRLVPQSQVGPSIALFGPNRRVAGPDCMVSGPDC